MVLASIMLMMQVAVPQQQSDDIVITAQRRHMALSECIASACPPDQEIEAALAAAVESFVAGRLLEAKRTLRTSISRNRRHVSQLPGKVSDLHATLGTVAEHEGDVELQRWSTYRSAAILEQHLGKAHPAAIRARGTIGQMLAAQGRIAEADRAYREAAVAAASSGQSTTQAILTFYRAWIAYQAGDRAAALKFAQSASNIAPNSSQIATLNMVLRIRLALDRQDHTAADRMIAGLRNASPAPLLISAPDFPDVSQRARLQPSAFQVSGRARWADLGFWIRPDGRVSEVQVLRSSEASLKWAGDFIEQIKGRRYSATATDSGYPGSYRIERFTLRPAYSVPTGSRIARAYGPQRLVTVDLTHLSAGGQNDEVSNDTSDSFTSDPNGYN